MALIQLTVHCSILIILIVYCAGSPAPHSHHNQYQYQQPVQYQRPVVVAAVPTYNRYQAGVVVPVRTVPVVPIRQQVPVVLAPVQYGYG